MPDPAATTAAGPPATATRPVVVPRTPTLLLMLAAAITVPAVPVPAAAQDPPTVSPAEYGQWEYLGSAELSPHGRWLAYGIRRVDETSELRVRPLDRDTTHVIPWASAPEFSPDGGWLAWTDGVSVEERERLQDAGEPVRNGATLLELATGEERSFDSVSRTSFDASGHHLALLGYAPREPSGGGTNLRILDLAAGTEVLFGDVSEFEWSDDGSLIAFTIATGGAEGNGVQVYDAASGRLQPLAASGSTYRRLAWRKDRAELAVLQSVSPADAADEEEEVTAFRILAWRGLDGETHERLELDATPAGVADTLEIVEHAPPRWSDDGRRIAFGLRPVEPTDEAPPDTAVAAFAAPADSTRADSVSTDGPADEDLELPGVQIWHSSDERIVPQQQSREAADARRTLLAVWHLEENRVVRIGSELRENASMLGDWQRAIEFVSEPYAWGAMFGRPYRDVWMVDTETGERRRVLERIRYAWPSPDGRYLLAFDGRDYWSHDLRSGDRTNLTEALPAAFADTAYDTPTDVLPPHGIGGWYEDDEAVLLYDEFDIWRVAPDGSGGERLTRGREEAIVHRVQRLDFDRPALDPDAPTYLSLRGEWSEKRGYARILPDGDVERLVFLDERVASLQRSDSTDVFLYRAEARDDSPDFFIAGPDLTDARQVTETNPFQADYAWTRSELIEFESETGRRLQAGLLYPADYEPGRRYPMIVYTYEILTPGIHAYEPPSERDYYNFTAWTQRGYFVLLPDIVFRARDPGVSAVEAVRPAVATVAEMGLVEPDRVGHVGHSWGGYEAAYFATHTDIFAAAVAGAPLTDFVSFMGQIHWNSGMPELSHWETGQGRMEVPYWEDPEAHHRNSPIHNVHEMETPLLMAFGDEDGVVDWDQGTEFYNFARRAGKQMVLLVYEGEDHGFRREPNQIDYHRRILEWFGHYLKGEPAPAWITDGVPLSELEDETRRVAEQESS